VRLRTPPDVDDFSVPADMPSATYRTTGTCLVLRSSRGVSRWAHRCPVARMVCGVKHRTILNHPWPSDLDPATVPFTGRTVTVLRRQGFFDDRALFNTATVSDVLSWWYAGPVTVNDLRTTGNNAIRQYHDEANGRRQIAADLEPVSSEAWAKQIWHHDPGSLDSCRGAT
jgi:hypothetical protein